MKKKRISFSFIQSKLKLNSFINYPQPKFPFNLWLILLRFIYYEWYVVLNVVPLSTNLPKIIVIDRKFCILPLDLKFHFNVGWSYNKYFCNDCVQIYIYIYVLFFNVLPLHKWTTTEVYWIVNFGFYYFVVLIGKSKVILKISISR